MVESSKRVSQPWNDEELSAALDAYLYMLQLQLSSIPFSSKTNSEILRSGPLHRRNDASIRYRMRNISSVLADRGLPLLRAFSPADQVGINVKSRLETLLDARRAIINEIKYLSTKPKEIPSLLEVNESLEKLKSLVSDLSETCGTRTVGIGHNKPPENREIGATELTDAFGAILVIQSELEKPTARTDIVESKIGLIAKFGMRIAIWSGDRLTDFAKAGAVAAGTGFGLSLSGLGSQIVESLSKVLGYLF